MIEGYLDHSYYRKNSPSIINIFQHSFILSLWLIFQIVSLQQKMRMQSSVFVSNCVCESFEHFFEACRNKSLSNYQYSKQKPTLESTGHLLKVTQPAEIAKIFRNSQTPKYSCIQRIKQRISLKIPLRKKINRLSDNKVESKQAKLNIQAQRTLYMRETQQTEHTHQYRNGKKLPSVINFFMTDPKNFTGEEGCTHNSGQSLQKIANQINHRKASGKFQMPSVKFQKLKEYGTNRFLHSGSKSKKPRLSLGLNNTKDNLCESFYENQSPLQSIVIQKSGLPFVNLTTRMLTWQEIGPDLGIGSKKGRKIPYDKFKDGW